MAKTFVLIHGTWHGGWAWRKVVQCLSSKGHGAHAPTLAGHGPAAARQGVTHQDCVASVVNYIRERSLSDIFLVGHSFGGTVAQKVAEQVVGRVARVIFLNALILKDQQCVFDVLPEVFLEALRPKGDDQPAETSSDETMQLLAPAPWETWRDNFMQDAPESLARSTWEQLSAEPNQVNLDSLDLKQFYSIAIPKSFIFCRQDLAMPPGYFHPGMSSRLGPHKLVEMDGSHEVMFTRPAELADKIVEASAD
jgi:pimeloyl-ACP methyl ester carboxylesterase